MFAFDECPACLPTSSLKALQAIYSKIVGCKTNVACARCVDLFDAVEKLLCDA